MTALIHKLLTASRNARLYQLERDMMHDELTAVRQQSREEDIARQSARIDHLRSEAIRVSTLHR